jgi:hypothetical protein
MVGVPAVVPVTIPVALPIAIGTPAPELHTPPVGPLSVMLPPGHILPAPEITVGNGFTVIAVVVAHPVPVSV